MYSYFGMSTVCPPGYSANRRWKGKRGQKQCLKDKKPKLSLKNLQSLARANDVSIYKRRKDGMGFTRSPLSAKALKLRLTRMKVSYFGMSTVCPPGYSANRRWKGKRGQKQCLKDKKPKLSLKNLQSLARANDVSIYKRRKDDMGFTKTPLSAKALKLRLTRMKVPYM